MRNRLAAAAAVAAFALLAGCRSGSSTSTPPATIAPSPSASASASTSASSAQPSTPASAPPTPITSYTAPPASLPVQPVPLTTAPPPWPPPLATDPQRTAAYVAAAGLPYAEEMLQVHYHAHLDVNVDGHAVTVPQYLGFVAKGNHVVGLAPLHTHDPSGIIHIENSVPAKFLLGQVFVEWGVRFTSHCLGPYCSGHGHELAVFVDGKRYAGDPTRLVLAKHQEIAVEYGATGRLPSPSSHYAFPAGS